MPYRVDLPADPHIRRILVIKWSAMGDVIIASALFEDIARAFPNREIHLNTLPAWKSLFEHDARFDRVFAVELRDRRHRSRQILEWLRQVRAEDVYKRQLPNYLSALCKDLWPSKA